MNPVLRLIHPLFPIRAACAIAVVAGGVLLPTVAHAQLSSVMTFTTTFPFKVGDTLLPAGHYTVRPATDNGGEVLRIDNRTARASVMFEAEPTAPRHPPADSEAMFKRMGDQYVLRTIWDANDEEGIVTFLTPSEKREARNTSDQSEQHVAALMTHGE